MGGSLKGDVLWCGGPRLRCRRYAEDLIGAAPGVIHGCALGWSASELGVEHEKLAVDRGVLPYLVISLLFPSSY